MSKSMRLFSIIALLLIGIIPSAANAQTSLIGNKAVAWSPDGSKIAVAGIEGLLQIRNADGSLFMDISTGFDSHFFSVAWSPDSQKIAAVGVDIGVHVWNISDPQYSLGALIATFDGHNDRPLAVAWSPDGTKLASGSLFGAYQLIVWDVVSFQSQPITQQVVAGVYALAWSPDGSQIAVGSAGGVLILDANLNILPYAPAPDYRLGVDEFTPAIAWSPDGSMVVGGYDTGEVVIFDVASKSLIQSLQAHTALVAAVAWSPDGNQIATGSYDGTIRIWNAINWSELAHFNFNNDVGLTSVAWSPDGTKIAYGGTDGLLSITPIPAFTDGIQIIPPETIQAVAWSPNGNMVAAGQSNGTINIWTTDTPQIVSTLTGHVGRVNDLAWDSTSTYLSSVGIDQTLRVWDIGAGGTLLYPPILHNDTVFSVIWSLDDTWIISISYQSRDNLHIWDAMTGSSIRDLATGGFFDLTFSPDGTRLAIANPGGLIAFRDGTTFTFIEDYIQYPERTGLGYDVYTVDWNSDGSQIVGGSLNGTVRIWDTHTLAMILDLPSSNSQQYSFTTTLIYDVIFSADDSLVAAISADGLIRVWDSHTGLVLSSTQLPIRPIYTAQWSPDGTQLAYGGSNGLLTIIPTPTTTD